MQTLLDWFKRTPAGDLWNVADVVLSLVGFIVTIVAVLKAKSAFEEAAAATAKLRGKLAAYDSIATLSSAITALNEIRRLHLDEKWVLLPDRYSSLRHALVTIRTSEVFLNPDQQETLQAIIQQFAELQRQVDKAIIDPERIPDRVKLNRTVSIQADRLTELLAQLRNN